MRGALPILLEDKLWGHCAECGKPLPFGALVTVSRYKSVELAPGLRVQRPDIMHCQNCKHLAQKSTITTHHKTPRPVPQTVEATRSTVQQLAIALYKAASAKPATAKKLAERIGVQHDKITDLILKKLAEKGKLRCKNGEWMKA